MHTPTHICAGPFKEEDVEDNEASFSAPAVHLTEEAKTPGLNYGTKLDPKLLPGGAGAIETKASNKSPTKKAQAVGPKGKTGFSASLARNIQSGSQGEALAAQQSAGSSSVAVS